MTDYQQSANPNLLEEPRKPSETLKVISVLTFIGSGLAILAQLYSFFTAQKSYDTVVQMQDKMDQAPDFVKKMMGPDPVGTARKTLEAKTPMLIIAIVASVLCIYGAMQMRQLKKQGFPVYVIGEVLPIFAYYIFIGQMSIFALCFSLLIAGLFIFLYASQRKYMS
ncbi:MAG: hypothetical protein JST68_03685 [Bacteroidetes bacterium]|nr:hypothetical protein [Bacteroidota bacterium]